MTTVSIKNNEAKAITLKPASLLPGASFSFVNNLGVDIKITVDGRKVKLEKA